jgi:hypothetical protein
MEIKLYKLSSGVDLLVYEDRVDTFRTDNQYETYWEHPLCPMFTQGRERPVLEMMPFPVPYVTDQIRFKPNLSCVLFEMELNERLKSYYVAHVDKMKAAKSGIITNPNQKKLILP